jgi:hypothetical protein
VLLSVSIYPSVLSIYRVFTYASALLYSLF